MNDCYVYTTPPYNTTPLSSSPDSGGVGAGVVRHHCNRFLLTTIPPSPAHVRARAHTRAHTSPQLTSPSRLIFYQIKLSSLLFSPSSFSPHQQTPEHVYKTCLQNCSRCSNCGGSYSYCAWCFSVFPRRAASRADAESRHAPCTSACDDPASPSCQNCCRTVTDWGCQATDRFSTTASCCTGDWDATCWNVAVNCQQRPCLQPV